MRIKSKNHLPFIVFLNIYVVMTKLPVMKKSQCIQNKFSR